MNTKQKAQLLELLPQLDIFDAITCSRLFQKAYGDRLNWHEFSYYLDELRTKGIVKYAGHTYDGMTGYTLAK